MSLISNQVIHQTTLVAPDQIKSLEFTFPVVGHSFLPSDRVFGLIEEKLRKQNIIIAREEYERILGEHAYGIQTWRKLANLRLEI
jgi:hypothetical protein